MKIEEKKQNILYQADEENKEEKRTDFDKTGKCRRNFKAAACCIALLLALTACSASTEQTKAGMDAIEAMDYQSALSHFEEAKKGGENGRLISRGVGIAYMGLADYQSAVECFLDALQKSDGLVQDIDYDLNYYLAAAYAKNGQPAEAESTYDAILAMKPKEADALFLRGNVRISQGKNEQACEDFEQVLALEPQNYDRMIQIFEVLNTAGLTQIGQGYLDSALSYAEGKNAAKMSSYDQGRIYYYLGRYQEAYAALEKARSEGSGGVEAYLYLGRAYEATGDYNYAATVYNSYIAQDTTEAEVYNQLGLCELKLGDYQAALTAFQAGLAVENNTMRQALSYNEIVAYEYLADFQRATVLMQNYLQNYPDDAKAQREYSFLSSR